MYDNINFQDYRKNLYHKKILMVDTDILSDIAKIGDSKGHEGKLIAMDTILLFSMPSMIELGFGPVEKCPIEEQKMYRSFYREKSAINDDLFVKNFHDLLCNDNLENYRGDWIGVSPDSHNWYFAKDVLISIMNNTKLTPSKAKDLQFDALIFAMAWNAGAILWTNNVKDHLKVNFYTFYEGSKRVESDPVNYIAQRMAPIFNIELMTRLINGETFNIYDELQKFTKDEKILNVLNIAANNIT